jgi:hypothetical protein
MMTALAHDLSIERRVLDRFLVEPHWSIAGLKVRLHDIDPSSIDTALVALVIAGVVIHERAHMRLAPAVSYLDALGLLAPTNGHSPPKGPDAATMTRILDAHRQREGQE